MSLTPKLLQQGAAGSARPVYIEDVFSTYLYTGTGANRTITNGIDLSTKGGLVWIKSRTSQDFGNNTNHWLFDSARTAGYGLYTNSTSSQSSAFAGLIPFNTTGFAINTSDPNLNGVTGGYGGIYDYTSWTFRKQPKFFDIVTLTADGSGNATFSHNLGTTPGCVILKRTDGISSWYVWHRSLTSTNYSINLHQTGVQADNGFAWITPGASTISINGGYLGASTQWVAYLFAHNAGGFGLTGNENVISCGSFTTNGSGNATVNLGYEPQWIIMKRTDSTSDWTIEDNMRGWTGDVGTNTTAKLWANLTSAEGLGNGEPYLNSTGFFVDGYGAGRTFIYIAIRRGPMKVPTTGTSVFAPTTYVPNGAASRKISTSPSFPVDLAFFNERSRTGYTGTWVNDRLRGLKRVTYIFNPQFDEEDNLYTFEAFNNDSVVLNGSGYNSSGTSGVVLWLFRRAPGFFDEVCYTGTGSTRTVTHNLGVVPELMIVKRRSGFETGGVVKYWVVYSSALGNTKCVFLNTTDNSQSTGVWNNTTPTSSVFTVENNYVNYSGDTYVAYLFASCPGVSKVGTYTGNGSTQTIDCGFAAGARFVLIKRTDSTGDWYTFDTARGIVSGNDPFLKLNTTTAESSSYDAVDPDNSGFIVNNDATNFPINVASATYIFLAIA